MAGQSTNKPWNLESFLDALIIELDKARDTLAIKAFNKPLTYSVKDLSLDLQLFPEFDGRQVKFTTAKPGETGASKISIQLASITDRQIRETSKPPVSKEETIIDAIQEIDEDTKKTLKKIGVSSVEDLQRMEEKNVDITRVVDTPMDVNRLAGQIAKLKRRKLSPQIKSLSLEQMNGKPVLVITGRNLALSKSLPPEVVINRQPVQVRDFSEASVSVDLSSLRLGQSNDLLMALDPHTVVKLNLTHHDNDPKIRK
jgi:hypothetical protein